MNQTPHNLLLGLLPLVLGAQLISWVVVMPQSARGYADFRQLYASGWMVRVGLGGKLYDYTAQLTAQNSVTAKGTHAFPFIRPAYQALLFLPLSFVSYRTAYFLWMSLNALSLLAAFTLIRVRFSLLAKHWKPLPWILFFGFCPVSVAIVQGQDSILLLLILAAALANLERNHEALAGSIVAVGLFKFQIVLPIAAIFILWRRWKFVKGFLVIAAVLCVVSLGVLGCE